MKDNYQGSVERLDPEEGTYAEQCVDPPVMGDGIGE